MVLGQAIDVVVERVETRRGADAGLPHRPAQPLLPAPRRIDELGAAGQHRAERRAEPLGEIDRDRIEGCRHLLGRDAAGDAGIHQPCAVHVRGPALAAGDGRHLVQLRQRPHRAAADVGRLLDLQQALQRRIAGARPDGGAHGVGGEHAARAGQRHDLHAGEGGMRRALAGEDVAGLVRDDLLAAAAVRQDGNDVAHRAGGQEYGCLLAQQRGHAVAQGMHGRVAAGLLIAHFGAPHRLAHRRGRVRLRIGIEIDADGGRALGRPDRGIEHRHFSHVWGRIGPHASTAPAECAARGGVRPKHATLPPSTTAQKGLTPRRQQQRAHASRRKFLDQHD